MTDYTKTSGQVKNSIHRARIMAILAALALMLISAGAFAAKIKDYTASNGVTYAKGMHINIGVGSLADGSFKYITNVFLDNASFGLNDANLDQQYKESAYRNIEGGQLKIKKIKAVEMYGQTKYYIVANGFTIEIEAAIKSGEVVN